MKIRSTFLILLSLFSLLNDASAQLLWSDPSAWTSFGSSKPVAGSTVNIPTGVIIILNETPPALTSLTISGKLQFANQNLNLTAGYIMVMGELEIGTTTAPYTSNAVITLTDANQSSSIMGMGTRGIMVMGGQLEIHGNPPSKLMTKLSNHATAGSTSVSLFDNVAWNVSDEVVVTTSDFYNESDQNAQRSTIMAVNVGNSLTLGTPLNGQRWGKLQYLTAAGLSMTSGTPPTNMLPGTRTVLDERAEVANLTRNIVIQSIDDAAWQNDGFGCHIMIMRMNGMMGSAHVDGLEIRRGGQAGKLGRYPFHWHMISYLNGAVLGDATGQYIKNSTINQSAQRGIVVHGTNGVEVSKNIVYDVLGHAIFTEDASERRNIFDGNLVVKVRNPLAQNALKLHETSNDQGASGFWISNPDNTVINNTATDCYGVGFWLAFPVQTFGQSAGLGMNPSLLQFGTFNNNTAHSNRNTGVFLDNVEINDEGETYPHRYTSTTDGLIPEWPYDNVTTYELADYTVWKNNTGGIWNRSAAVRNRRVVSADNTNMFFSGASDNILSGEIEKTLVVGKSFNYNMNGITIPTTWGSTPPVAFASYHSTFNIKDNVVVNFDAAAGSPSGAFALNDYYLIPVDKGTVRNTNNIIINSHPGVRTMPELTQHVYGAVWDPHNYWGGPTSQDNFYVFNNPFFTYGMNVHVVPPSPAVSGGVIVDGPFYGFDNYEINGIYRTYDKINAIRTTEDGTEVGNWMVEAGQEGDILGNMRHFATHPTGFYYLDFPTINDIHEFNISASNMLDSNDYQVISVEYSGDYNIVNLFSSTAYNMTEFGNVIDFPLDDPNTHPYTSVSSFNAVLSATKGEVYWHDKTNNKVWFKVRGGLNPGDPSQPSTTDENLYKGFRIRAYGELAPLSVNELTDNLTVSNIYPNPTTGTLNVDFTTPKNEQLKIVVTDLLGREFSTVKVNSKSGKNSQILNFNQLPAGIYLVTLTNGSDIQSTNRIVKK